MAFTGCENKCQQATEDLWRQNQAVDLCLKQLQLARLKGEYWNCDGEMDQKRMMEMRKVKVCD